MSPFWWGFVCGWASTGMVALFFVLLLRGAAEHWHDGVKL